MSNSVSHFIDQLQRFPRRDRVFNPWSQVDPEHDASSQAPENRAHNLYRYLSERTAKARLLLIAEAPGYQGCHFSGIAMTSERILLGHHIKRGVLPSDVFRGDFVRSTRPDGRFKAIGANEPTATIVWGLLKQANIDSRDVVLWNAFAFHPMGTGLLTNRKPTLQELSSGRHLLEAFLQLFPDAQPVAIGDVSQVALSRMGIPVAAAVRHPSYGGASKFRAGLSDLLRA